MAKRKTVSIRSLVENVNARNLKSTCSPEARTAWNLLLEGILMDAQVYAGFGYIREGLPDGQEPGVRVDPETRATTFPDESRRFYYMHHSL